MALRPGDTAPPEGWEAQTRLTFENVGIALEAAGATWSDVVKFTIFLTDLSEIALVRSIRDEFVNTERPPASSAVGVTGLVHPDFLIEIEALAAV